jgi:preprotein translocase subunit SecG
MNTLLITFHVIVCLIIIFIVLLQVGRGAEAGAMFGGAGQAQTLRGQSTFIGKFTTAMAVAFMITSFLLTYDTSSRAKSSVVESIKQEEVQTLPTPTEQQQAIPVEAAPQESPAGPTTSQAPQN